MGPWYFPICNTSMVLCYRWDKIQAWSTYQCCCFPGWLSSGFLCLGNPSFPLHWNLEFRCCCWQSFPGWVAGTPCRFSLSILCVPSCSLWEIYGLFPFYCVSLASECLPQSKYLTQCFEWKKSEWKSRHILKSRHCFSNAQQNILSVLNPYQLSH